MTPLPHEGCAHQPTITAYGGGVFPEELFITCPKCGLLLDFRPLSKMKVYTEDWGFIPRYKSPAPEEE